MVLSSSFFYYKKTKALMNPYIRTMRDFSMVKWFIFQEYYNTNLTVNWVICFFFFLICSKVREVLSYIRAENKARRWLDILSGSISRKKYISNVSPPHQRKTRKKKEKGNPPAHWNNDINDINFIMTLFQHVHKYEKWGYSH